MPRRSPRPCRVPGCGALTQRGYCDQHRDRARDRHRDYNRARPDYHAWYGLRIWQRLRALHRRQQPLCVACERAGRLSPVEHVDHIREHGGDWDLFIDPGNLQSLCESCHNTKTGRAGSGTPIDPNVH